MSIWASLAKNQLTEIHAQLKKATEFTRHALEDADRFSDSRLDLLDAESITIDALAKLNAFLRNSA